MARESGLDKVVEVLAIDLAAGRTLSVPFLSGARDTARIAFLDFAGGQREPLDSLEVAFAEDATVPGGLIAVYDENGFVGDARFAGADGGETSILPFAASSDIDTTLTERGARRIVSASVANGALVIRREATRSFEIAARISEPTTLVVDFARFSNEEIEVSGGDGVEASSTRVDAGRERVRVDLPVGTRTIVVGFDRIVSESILLTSLTTPIIEEVLSQGGAIGAGVREQLEEVRGSLQRLAEIEREIDRLERDRADKERTIALDRENLQAIDATTPEAAEVRRRVIAETDEVIGLTARIRELRDEAAVLANALARR